MIGVPSLVSDPAMAPVEALQPALVSNFSFSATNALRVCCSNKPAPLRIPHRPILNILTVFSALA
jgi:hypothetical protein